MIKRRYLTIIAFLASFSYLTNAQTKKISYNEYLDKVKAYWYGQLIGNIYGLPHENAYIDEPGPDNFPYGYGHNLKKLKDCNGAFSDDDTDFEYMYLLQMEKFGIEPSYRQLTEAWKYHVRGRVWLANRATLGAMHYGYTPPVTGLKAFNPHWFQIDPQLVNEIWATTAPGMIRYAAGKSEWAARMTTDDWALEPTIHYGAMYAAAFFEKNIEKLIRIGNSVLPQGSRFARTTEEMIALYHRYPADWKKARKEVATNYYINEPEVSKSIWNANLNGACGILALLYGNGDFQKTLDMACALGFDCDNQAATICGLLGVMYGTHVIPQNLLMPIPEWKEPFNNFYKNVTRYDMPDAKLDDLIHRIVLQGEKVILAHGGKKTGNGEMATYSIPTQALFQAPVEIASGPVPVFEVNQTVDHKLYTSAKNNLTWNCSEKLPEGLRFSDGHFTGNPSRKGVFPVKISLRTNYGADSINLEIHVAGKNLAREADAIISNMNKSDSSGFRLFERTIPNMLITRKINALNDGKIFGDSASFYSITNNIDPKIDYYGYSWNQNQSISALMLYGGVLEESGGWMSSLFVQYKDENDAWCNAKTVRIFPKLPLPAGPYNSAPYPRYFVEIEPVKTKSIRVLLDSGGWMHFTSVTELQVFE